MTTFVCGACGANYGPGDVHPCGGRNDFGSISGRGVGVVGDTPPALAQTVTAARVEPVMSTNELVDVVRARCAAMLARLQAASPAFPFGDNKPLLTDLRLLVTDAQRCVELVEHIARRNAANAATGQKA